jgi:hypothetical protein
MKIALIMKHDGSKTYLMGFNGKPMEWPSREAADQQISLLKKTSGYGPSEPKHFDYAIED